MEWISIAEIYSDVKCRDLICFCYDWLQSLDVDDVERQEDLMTYFWLNSALL